ncbi:MAG: deoxyribose-phosphate aldolase [Nitritalea sp.]
MEINTQAVAALAQTIEHTALKPDLDAAAIERLVDEAKVHGLFGVCVPPFWIKKAKRDIGLAPVQLVTVVGFPLGYQQTEVKVLETELALKHGADEIDVVWSLSAFKAGMTWPKIELAKLAKICHEQEKLLKVIVETAYLSEEELGAACMLCADAGVDFVKTSTGFAPTGATVEAIRIMRASLPAHVGIKASGGIKTLADAEALLAAGADRIGTSSGVALVREARARMGE